MRASELEALNRDLQSELQRRTEMESRLADLLTQEQLHAVQLRDLADAALAINSSLSIDDVVLMITEQARVIIGAHEAVTSFTANDNWAQAISVVSLSDKYEAWRGYSKSPDGSGIYGLVCETNRPMRLAQGELERHPAYRGFGAEAGSHPPLNGWLAAPLVGRDGRNLGLIQLSDKYEGEFDEQDESMLVQLAQMASAAVENARLYREAQEAIRARDAFLSVASHELKTPVTSIKAYSQLLARHAGEMSERVGRMLKNIISQSDRLATLVNELLDVTRVERGLFALSEGRVDFMALVEEEAGQARMLSDKHSISVRNDAGSPLVIMGDHERLRQVLANLLENGIKYSPSGGEVQVRLERDGANVTVSVRDNGIGIPASHLQNVFERFYRAPNASVRNYGGLGLGLHISREIVERHGGRMWVESEEERGSTFFVSLPLEGYAFADPVQQPADYSH